MGLAQKMCRNKNFFNMRRHTRNSVVKPFMDGQMVANTTIEQAKLDKGMAKNQCFELFERKEGYKMAGRKIKITTDQHDRADQRRRTEELAQKTDGMEQLQITPPRYLTGYASASWRELVPLLNKAGLVKQVDKAVVISLCEQIQLARMAYEDVNENGLSSGSRKNPAASILDSATAKIKSLSDALGLSPQARASIVLDNDDEDNDGPTLKEALKANDKEGETW